MSSLRFAGKSALVTGAGGGLGSEIARRLHAEGATIFAADLAAESARGDAPAGRWHAVVLDVRDPASWSRVLRDIAALDVLVNCAGIIRAGTIESVELATWDAILATNATGTMLGCKNAVEAMKARGGAIVNLSTAMVPRPQAVQIAYGASKAAVEHITRAVAIHCGRAGYRIRCNAIEPGALDSPMLLGNRPASLSEAAYVEAVVSRHPLGRLGTFGDVASAALFLASDAASYITGAVLPVDGGASA